MAASTIALLLVSAGFIAYERVTFQRSMVTDLSTEAAMIAHYSAAALRHDASAECGEILKALSAKPHIVAAALYQGDKLVAWYPGTLKPESFPGRPQSSGWRFDHGSLTLFHEINAGLNPLGTVYLKSDLAERNERLERYALIVALFLLVSLAVTYFLSSWLQRIISRPIFHLAETARIVLKEKNYSVRAQKQSNDELGRLIDVFNEMLSYIQQRESELQQANDQLEKRVHERTRDFEQEITERRRAEAALQEQFTRTSLLNQITQVISERQDLESILYVVLRQLEDHFGIELGLVCLFDPAREAFNVAALRTANPLLAPKLGLRDGMTITMDQSGLRVCKHGELIRISDTIHSDAMLFEHLASAGFRSAAAIPLMVENKPFGVLIVARLQPEGISPSECAFLLTLGKHVALAAHQAQLHAELAKAYFELRQTQQAVMQQERLKALGQMASGIAHDVNNALSPIVGFADLLTQSENNVSPTGRKYLQYIKTAGEDIAHIVARLREFYRRRDASEPLTSISLNDIARQVVDMTRPRWRDIPQGLGIMVEMRMELDENAPELAGIESEVREALTNLIINAVDAMPNGGAITVRTQAVATGFPGRNGVPPTHVVLEVVDTGTGMDEQTRKHCMEPFYSTKGKRGTGLGLAMVYGVMERHEGKIDIESALGKGTSMRLIFPIRVLSASGTLERREEEKVPPLHILCIDDEPLLRELLREILERDGHHIEVADSGQAGVNVFLAALAHRQPFDVVITDLGMPYFDGRQVAKVIKRESPETPVVMLTGWGAIMKEDGDVPAQVDGVLSKPPRSKEIREMLRRLARNRAAVREKSAAA